MPYFIKANYSSQELSPLVSVDSMQNVSSEEWEAQVLQTNLSWTNTTTDYVPYERRPETYIVPCIFAIIFLLGLAGNGTLVYAFFQQRSLRTLPNTLIISLSVGDLLTICGALPFVSTIYTVDSWPYGPMVCKLSELIRDLSSGVSVYTLALLSLDRYLAIVRPLRRYTGARSMRRRRRTLASVAGVWALSFAFAAPGLVNSHLLRISVSPGRHILVCYPFPPRLGPGYARAIVMLKFLALYLIPLLIIGGFYAAMARHLFASAAQLRAANRQTGVQANSQVRSRVKVAKIVLAFILIFALCFFPSHVFLLWFYYFPGAYDHYNKFWHLLRIVGFVLTFTSSCLNPIALYFISGVFRKHFQQYLCGLWCCWSCCMLVCSCCFDKTKEQPEAIDASRSENGRTHRATKRRQNQLVSRSTPTQRPPNDRDDEDDEEEDEDGFDTEDTSSGRHAIKHHKEKSKRSGKLIRDCCPCCPCPPSAITASGNMVASKHRRTQLLRMNGLRAAGAGGTRGRNGTHRPRLGTATGSSTDGCESGQTFGSSDSGRTGGAGGRPTIMTMSSFVRSFDSNTGSMCNGLRAVLKDPPHAAAETQTDPQLLVVSGVQSGSSPTSNGKPTGNGHANQLYKNLHQQHQQSPPAPHANGHGKVTFELGDED